MAPLQSALNLTWIGGGFGVWGVRPLTVAVCGVCARHVRRHAFSSAAAMSASLTEREAEVYDRQIRLWGLEAQRRMKDSKVLVLGLGAANAEVCVCV